MVNSRTKKKISRAVKLILEQESRRWREGSGSREGGVKVYASLGRLTFVGAYESDAFLRQ